ncbi:MAG TPA: YbdK family carboxylate-amine ligase [Chryseolinea sp.]|nr:YbdK family carboxylate-amine ligase [Chryseolinea sp.]
MKKQHIEGLEFKRSEHELSIGVELELQVLDRNDLLLTPRAQDILDRCNLHKLDHEFFQSTLEIKSDVCYDVFQLNKDLAASIAAISDAAKELKLSLGSTGTHPLSDYRETLITHSPRYDQLIDRNQWIIRRMAVYGMHVHVGMASGDACIQYNYFFLHMLPHILALSASSPFWQGKYTGLSACRPTTYESLPTAGMPYLARNWEAFQHLYQFLQRSGSIESMKDLWWDIRPSPTYGTLELRFCDEPATLYEATAIAAFIHLLAHWYRDRGSEWTTSHAPLKQWIFRENKWRTLRYGLDANIVITRTGKTKSLRKDILDWLLKLRTYAQRLNYTDQLSILEEIVHKGNSSQRQHKVFTETNDLDAVVRHNVSEFERGYPDWIGN